MSQWLGKVWKILLSCEWIYPVTGPSKIILQSTRRRLNSAEENEFVLNLIQQRQPSLRIVWIDLKWDSSVKQFLWNDHSVPVYKNWAPNEPNGKANEPCGNMWIGHNMSYRPSGTWNDRPCTNIPSYPCGSVCKRLP